MKSVAVAESNNLAPTTRRNVVVTGATGFLGGALTRNLVAKGHQVRALARTGSDKEGLAGLEVEWFQGDVTEPQSLAGLFENADWVIHAAGMLGQWGIAESTYHELHAGGTRHVLDELSATADPKRVLYVSSPGVLGPIRGRAADESAALAPSNAYERSKASAEQIAREGYASGLPVIIARPEFIYGPGDRHVLGLFRAIQKGIFFYVGNGRNSCHPTYIDDAVDGLLRCLEHGRPGKIYHITGPRPVTFCELAQTIADATGSRPPRLHVPAFAAMIGAAALEIIGRLTGRRPPLTRTAVAFFSESRRFSWQRAYQELGYRPRIELEEGVRCTVEWYRKQGLLA